jgi:TolB protein
VGVFVLGPDHQELVCVPAPHVEDEMSFQWSPDGKRILYTSDRLFENGMDGDSVKSRLVMVDAYSGKLSYPLTWGHEVRYPRWSPDGRTIVFVAGGEQGANPFDRFDLYEMDAAGGDPKRLSEDHTAKRCPVWSPDGRKIAFEWEDPIVMVSPNTGTGGIACLGIIDMRTRKAVRVTKSDRSIWRPQWSPDGQRIVLFRKATLGDDGDIVVMEPDGRNERILAKGEGSKDHVRWSPDGSKLAFCWTRDGIPQIWLVNADGTGLKKVTGELEGVIDPEWAPLR